MLALALLARQADPLPSTTGSLRAITGMVLVLGLVCVLAWLARRGTLRLPGAKSRVPIAVESAVALGERRSLLVVSVEGRRLLLGLTPMQVSLVTELAATPPPSFAHALDRRATGPGDGE
jgi:flagellar protein FliO/FliZ